MQPKPDCCVHAVGGFSTPRPSLKFLEVANNKTFTAFKRQADELQQLTLVYSREEVS